MTSLVSHHTPEFGLAYILSFSLIYDDIHIPPDNYFSNQYSLGTFKYNPILLANGLSFISQANKYLLKSENVNSNYPNLPSISEFDYTFDELNYPASIMGTYNNNITYLDTFFYNE